MTVTPRSDLADLLTLRSGTGRVQSQIIQTQKELLSNRSAKPYGLGGAAAERLHGIESRLARLEADDRVLTLAAGRWSAQTEAIAEMRQALGTVAIDLAGARDLGQSDLTESALIDARDGLDRTLAALSTRYADRAVFSGAQTDRAPLPDAATLLADATASIGAAADPSAELEAYFGPGGRLETTLWAGAPAASLNLASGEPLPSDPTALDPAITELLKGYVGTLLAADTTLPVDAAERSELADAGLDALSQSSDALVALEARVGRSAETGERLQARGAARQTSLVLERDALGGVDPYEAASRLQAYQDQLDTLFVLTRRMSELSLTRYLG
ncbi:hypothetical protein [Pontivivens ytuae]|uniref:Flagellin n=1 Tax=Pontivivens ytuae TaxID=2789856 RepID=A0A7S9LQ86_9RHOB|nr:hypothetical protein [Pontivivens ytuae]QPH53111.1 hypothetical protein I0K15_15075 [Pontivivens ytuae]